MNVPFLEPHTLVRTASIYVVLALTAAAWAWTRPSSRVIGGGVLAFAWNVSALFLVNVLAIHFQWWRFDAEGGVLVGVPVDLLLAWAWFWGALPAIAFPDAPLPLLIGIALAFDIALMPAAGPVLMLGHHWLVGEALALAAALVPSQLLCRWTATRRCLGGRAALQLIAFANLVMFVIPAMAIDVTGSAWSNPLTWSSWRVGLALQALAVPAAIGISALQEFVVRGGGTPVPFDPPARLVTSGLYAYVRNPMQVGGTLLLMLVGVLLWNPYVSLGAVLGHAYAAGFAAWNEEEDLRERFGAHWIAYRSGVPAWIPRVRPWCDDRRARPRLYVSESCNMCREVARWFDARGVRGLRIVAAEAHPTRALERVTYEPDDGTGPQSGVAAIGRALEHIHLGWALVACCLRLPVVQPLVQVLVDACGGGPREISAAAAGHDTARCPRCERV